MAPHARDQRKARPFLLLSGLLIAVGLGCTGQIGRNTPAGNGGGTSTGIGASTGAGAQSGTGGVGAPGVYVPAQPALRLLTVAQYQNSMRALLGSSITLPADLELDTVLNGFVSIGASKVDLSPLAVEQLESAALAAAKQVLSDTANRGALVGCTPAGTTDDACARSFVTSFGRRAWRRPLTAEEVTRYAGIANNASMMLGNFYGGLEYALAGLLQSPNFIYRAEIGEPDPQDPNRRILNDYEVATRLSYFLSATTPDDALLDAALGGGLATPGGLQTAAQRLVDAPAARVALESFFTELLRLSELDNLSQLPSIFPAAMSTTLGASMRTETLRVLEDIAFARNADYRTLFDTTNTFVNGELAKIYGLTSPTGTGFVATTLPAAGPRAGILGQAGFLAMTSHPNATSPTRRGKFIREVFLCQSVDPPPPDVDPTFPPDASGPQTMRQRLESHSQNTRCAGCHGFLDPIGLGLETFDGIGAYRTQDAGQTIDASGTLDGQVFADARGLGAALKNHAGLGTCLTRGVFRYAFGHLETTGEAAVIIELNDKFTAGGYRFKGLLLDTATSIAFRQVGKLD
jgi:hypothetical protein